MNDLCSIELLRNAVARGLSADEEAALHAHLEHCEACCAQMEQLAGGEVWRQEAAELLSADELDAAVPESAAWSEVDFSVEHLDPSDDVNVLGQLGGYDVLAIVGRGGMGVVLKAFDRELKRFVAIKVLAPHLAHSSVARKRFAREAQAAAAVVNPHVIAIHHVQPTGRLPFLIMPLLTGESLAQRLKARGPLELTEVLRIGMQAAAGLAAAHDQGLVHRDVKPANIFLEKGVERVVITDFGLARAADDVSMTRLGVVAGTPEYMSPEQAQGEALDGRSDLFSLGCVLYEMATGVSPFRADSTMATLRRIVEEPPAAMASLGPELPPWFNGIVERLLSKDLAQRFASASEVSQLLEQCLSHLQQPASVPLPASLVRHGTRRRSIFNVTRKRVIVMLGVLGVAWLGMVLWPASEAPDNPRIDKFAELDTDHDGRLSMAEFGVGRTLKYAAKWFERRDADHDGFLSLAEFVPQSASSVRGKPPDEKRSDTMSEEEWFVTDIDFESEESAKDELKRFLEANPNAVRVPPLNANVLPGTNSDSRIATQATAKQLGTVLGKPIHESDLNKNVSTGDNLKRLLLQPLTENYCRQHKLDRAEELQTKIKDEKRRAMARFFVLPAELNRHLFEKHGGRVILSPFGPVAFDGLKKWMEEREQAGDFEITDPQLKAKVRELWMQEPVGVQFASPDQIKAAFDPALTDRFIENIAKRVEPDTKADVSTEPQEAEKPTARATPKLPKLPDEAYTTTGIHCQKFREEDAKRSGGELMGDVVESKRGDDPLVLGMRLASDAKWNIGGQARVELVVRNASASDVKFTQTPRSDNGLSVVAIDKDGKEHQAEIAQFRGRLTLHHLLLPRSHVVMVKSFTLRFGSDKDLLDGTVLANPGVAGFHLPPGDYTLRCKWNDARPQVAHEGEWAGELVSVEHKFTLTAAPAATEK